MALGATGWRLGMTGRDTAGLAETARLAEAAGAPETWTVAGNLAGPDAATAIATVSSLFGTAADRWGGLDLLFNNAGTGRVATLAETDDALWDATIALNLTAPMRCCRAALPLFAAAGGGLIINNASVAATRGFPGFTAYCAAKAGLLGFSRALREEARGDGVRVAVLLPGATATDIWDFLGGEWDRTKMIQADDLARLVVAMADAPANVLVEELTIMPASGAL